jgi:hypothetical protein
LKDGLVLQLASGEEKVFILFNIPDATLFEAKEKEAIPYRMDNIRVSSSKQGIWPYR